MDAVDVRHSGPVGATALPVAFKWLERLHLRQVVYVGWIGVSVPEGLASLCHYCSPVTVNRSHKCGIEIRCALCVSVQQSHACYSLRIRCS